MARPKKIGLDYFPFDVDFFDDIKVRKLIRRQGGKAVAVYALLLCFIYKSGYYMGSDEELPFVIAEKTGYDEAYIQQVINNLFSLGFFDKTLYENHKIITSKGVQIRYLEVQKNRKMNPDMPKFNLISGVNSEESTQKESKVKESKVKKRKENLESTTVDSSSGGEPPDAEETVDYKKFVEFFNAQTNGAFGIAKYPLGEKRKASIRARVREHGKQTLFDVIKKASESDFLKGNGQRGFVATLDWIIKPSNFEKILSGNYVRSNSRIQTKSAGLADDDIIAAVQAGMGLAAAAQEGGRD